MYIETTRMIIRDFISNEGFAKVQFSFDGVTNVPRIILTGNTADVLRLVNGYFQEYPLDQSAI